MAEEFSFSVDSDWKKQAQEEKRRLAEESDRQKSAAATKAHSTSPTTTSPTGTTAAAGTARRRRRGRDELPEPSFTTLVQTLASQALLYLGGVATAGGEAMVDLDMAKHQIDLLAVLEEKAHGNLAPDEQAALDVTLYETRMRYVGVASRYIL